MYYTKIQQTKLSSDYIYAALEGIRHLYGQYKNGIFRSVTPRRYFVICYRMDKSHLGLSNSKIFYEFLNIFVVCQFSLNSGSVLLTNLLVDYRWT